MHSLRDSWENRFDSGRMNSPVPMLAPPQCRLCPGQNGHLVCPCRARLARLLKDPDTAVADAAGYARAKSAQLPRMRCHFWWMPWEIGRPTPGSAAVPPSPSVEYDRTAQPRQPPWSMPWTTKPVRPAKRRLALGRLKHKLPEPVVRGWDRNSKMPTPWSVAMPPGHSAISARMVGVLFLRWFQPCGTRRTQSFARRCSARWSTWPVPTTTRPPMPSATCSGTRQRDRPFRRAAMRQHRRPKSGTGCSRPARGPA